MNGINWFDPSWGTNPPHEAHDGSWVEPNEPDPTQD